MISEESFFDRNANRRESYFHETLSGQAFFFDPEDPKSRREAKRKAGAAAREAMNRPSLGRTSGASARR